MTVPAERFFQFVGHTSFSSDQCYPFDFDLAPLAALYLTDEKTLNYIYTTIVQGAGGKITRKSGEMIENALSDIVKRLNRTVGEIAKKVRCASIRPLLCSALKKAAQIIPLNCWDINLLKAPPNSY